ncbi:MAG TPA: hypothetical protein ENI52_04490 [Thermoplasmata archaeon]|nr:hypothetical protein [Thermoplasmata archaeon]
MFEKFFFTEKRIQQISKKERYDPTLIEKLIYAFELLGKLAEKDIRFIFKGGTSMILILKGKFSRLSVDLDIILLDESVNLPQIFNELIKEAPFTRWVEDIRQKQNREYLRHYKFYYESVINKREEPVLIDILFLSKNPYIKTINKIISVDFLKVEEDINIFLPSFEDLFADKLTAFAPQTIGIQYHKGKSTEIIKQLFDLGKLFHHINDLDLLKKSYKNLSDIEALLRGYKPDFKKFLEDSFLTAFLICQLDFRDSISDARTKELKDGIRRIKNFVKDGKYSLLSAKEDASKIAFVISILRNDLSIDIKNFIAENLQTPFLLHKPLKRWKILNKLRKISPSSFYLWQIIEEWEESERHRNDAKF